MHEKLVLFTLKYVQFAFPDLTVSREFHLKYIHWHAKLSYRLAGHPYLTGLSIAGGLYYFGIEGAFVGPMVLCFVLVGVNLYRCLMLESTDRAQVTRETALRTRVASIDRYRSVNKPRLKLYAHRRNIYRISPKKQTSPMHVQILRARSEGADFGK
uniref:Golgi apparatus membrane protein TVP23 n=1 Tax=Mesocestoides corti TaxID=53468 RepID=A0A5K3FAL6_MESCO